MAVFRQPNHCIICGELIKEIHREGDLYYYGDTFIGYENHQCKGESKVIPFDTILEKDKKELLNKILTQTKSFKL